MIIRSYDDNFMTGIIGTPSISKIVETLSNKMC